MHRQKAEWFGIATVFAALVVLVPTTGRATAIFVGNHQLLPNTPGQTIDILIEGTAMIGAVDFFMVVNGGVAPAPVVTAIDLTGPGTIFNGNNTGLGLFGAPDNPPSIRIAAATTTVSGAVLADGVLARVTVDTTGVPAGLYPLSLANHPVFGPTDLGTNANFDFIYPTIYSGFLSTVLDVSFPDPDVFYTPEPSTLALRFCGIIVIGAAAARNSRGRSRPAFRRIDNLWTAP